MPHPLVTQLRFTRSEWIRGLKAVTADEAVRRFSRINPIAWMIGHLAWQEQLYWLERAQSKVVVPEVKQFGYGKPLAVPPLDEAWAWWRTVTAAADPFLDGLTDSNLTRRWKRESSKETPGTKLHRTTYHYWFHLGESQAIRQMLGSGKLPDFVGGFGKSQILRVQCFREPMPPWKSTTSGPLPRRWTAMPGARSPGTPRSPTIRRASGARARRKRPSAR